jgi:hypothetical protein
MANSLRQNTVRIESTRSGFGFITGERGGYLYIVTARHILVPRDTPDVVVPKTAKVSFFSDQGQSYDAEVLGTHKADVGVLRVQKPAGFDWMRSCLADTSKEVRGTPVWYIGRKGEWFVPVRPGAIASPPSSSFGIEVDDLRVTPGTSGAPLVTDRGIVGMILSDSEDVTTAISIEFIQRVFREWNHPWELTVGAGPKASGGPTADGNPPKGAVPGVVDDSLDGSIYTNRTAHFQLTLPTGWQSSPELRKEQPEIIAALRSADQSLILFVTPEVYSGTLNTYKLLAEATFKSKFKDYERLTESPSQLDGRQGLRMVFQGTSPAGEIRLKFLVYIIPYEDRMIRLSFTTLEPLFDEAVPTFEKIATSYRSLGAAQAASTKVPQPSTASGMRSDVDEALDGPNYVNRTGGFRLTVPKDWKLAPDLRKDTPEVIAALSSPDEASLLLVTPEEFKGNLNTYKVLAETTYKGSFKAYEKLSESPSQLDGRQGLRMVFLGTSETPSGDVRLKFLVYFVPYEDRVIRLNFTTLEPLFDEAVPTFEKIAASYRRIASPKPSR